MLEMGAIERSLRHQRQVFKRGAKGIKGAKGARGARKAPKRSQRQLANWTGLASKAYRLMIEDQLERGTSIQKNRKR